MFNLSAKKFYLINSFTGFVNVYNTKVISVESKENTLVIEMNVNPASLDFESLSDRIYTTITYNLVNDTFTIKCEGKGSRKHSYKVKYDVTGIIEYLVSEANKAYKVEESEARWMTEKYYCNLLTDAGGTTQQSNEMLYNINHTYNSIQEVEEAFNAIMNELQPIVLPSTIIENNSIQSEVYYTVYNRSFSTYEEAVNYCIDNDFDPEIMITKVATQQPSLSITDTQPKQTSLYNYKDIFYFNQYDVSKLTEKDWNKDINRHNSMYYQLKDNEIINVERLQTLIDNNYSFYIQIANDNPYKRSDMYMISVTLLYMNKPFSTYINKDTLEKFIQLNNEPVKVLQAV